MCSSSICQLGALSVSSFAELINSAGNLIVDMNNSHLGDDLIKILMTLRMNRDFMLNKINAPNYVENIDKEVEVSSTNNPWLVPDITMN